MTTVQAVGAVSSLEFCILHRYFCPFYKRFQDFSGVRIQGGVAKNLLFPNAIEGNFALVAIIYRTDQKSRVNPLFMNDAG